MNQITIDGIDLEYDFDFTKPDSFTGFNGDVEVTNVRLQYDDRDITELLSPRAIKKIEDKAWIDNYKRR